MEIYKIGHLLFEEGIVKGKVKIVPIIFNKECTKFKDLLSNQVYNLSKNGHFEQISELYNFENKFCGRSIIRFDEGEDFVGRKKLLKTISKYEKIFTEEYNIKLAEEQIERKYEETERNF